MRTFVIGDIHGAYKALIQAIKRSGIDYSNDRLICLGDVCDGWSDVYECFDELSKFKNLVFILGNHDKWFIDWMEIGVHPDGWRQGGFSTVKSYASKAGKEVVGDYSPYHNEAYITTLTPEDIPVDHQNILNNHLLYYIDDDNNLYVHGGYNNNYPIEATPNTAYYWDRKMWRNSLYLKEFNRGQDSPKDLKTVEGFKKIFIGHTSTVSWDTDKPIKAAQVWNLDTGAGFRGKLTIMNVDTEEYWQSDLVQDLYKNQKGRN